jgi:hypothetical protein
MRKKFCHVLARSSHVPHKRKTYLEFHTLRCCTSRQPDTPALPEEECGGISKFHAGEVDADTGSRASTEGMESELRGRGLRFGNHLFVADPPLWIETVQG